MCICGGDPICHFWGGPGSKSLETLLLASLNFPVYIFYEHVFFFYYQKANTSLRKVSRGKVLSISGVGSVV